MSEDGTPLGTMYMDLHPRKNKYGNAAHFTVRCGCALKNSESEEEDVAYQLPIVTLVCSLSSTNDMGFMSHQEVETLLHEFGHGLHSLLSRTKFQHMAGTRASMDFVETPSHLFENFAWDPDFLKILGAHYASSDLIPDEIITALRKSRIEFAALERQNQLIYSLFDQKLFHVHENMSAMEIFRGLFAEYDVPYAENTHWFSRFAHLVTYGATYYGYQYAHVFSTDIWKTCFEGRSLQRQSGEQLWRKMLIYGGARDPNRMLHDLLGRPPDFSTYYSE
jgi:intermediate peptidase